MKENIRAKLLGLCRRLEELDAMLAAPDAADDMKRFTELSRERAEIEPVVLKTKEYEQTLEDIARQEKARRTRTRPANPAPAARPGRQQKYIP